MHDDDIHQAIEELSLDISKFCQAVQIFTKFIQTCIISSISDWSPKVKDENSQ